MFRGFTLSSAANPLHLNTSTSIALFDQEPFLSETRDREAAKRFLKKALSNPDNLPPHVFARDGLRSYPAAIRELKNEGLIHRHCRHRGRPYANNRIESDHRSIKRRLRQCKGHEARPPPAH